MTMPRPYLKLDRSEVETAPEAVTVTLGATSLMRQAERMPSAPILALTSPMGAL